MDVISAKKGRIPLQYKPKLVQEDDISDDEYNVMTSNKEDILLPSELSSLLSKLQSYKEKTKTIAETTKSKYLAITGNSITLTKSELEDDFNRESCFKSLHLSNMQQLLPHLIQNSFKIGDQNPQQRTFLKQESKKAMKPAKKKKNKAKVTRFEDNFDFSVPELEGNGEEEEKKHMTFSEYQREKAQRLKNKNRPGKRSRDRYKSKNRSSA